MRVAPAATVGTLGVVIVGIGRVFGLVEMYVLGTGLALAAVLAVITTRSRIVLVEVERQPNHVEPSAGQEFGIELTVRAVRRSPGFELSDHISSPGPSPGGRVEISVPPLRRHQRTISRYKIRPESRGVITLGPATVDFGDPLGLSRRTRVIGTPDDIVIRPRWTPIALPELRECEGDLVRMLDDLTRNLAADLEFRAMREYVPGDDARYINWRASARRDLLIVNEYESHSDIVLDVYLDTWSLAFTPDGFETAVSIAASFVESAEASAGSDVRVRLSFGSHPDEKPDVADRNDLADVASARPMTFDAVIDDSMRSWAMRSLATLTTTETESLPRPVAERTGVIVPVVICGRRDRAWLERVHRALLGSPIAVTVTCEGTDGLDLPERWFLVDGSDLAAFARNWAVLCRRRTDS